MVTIGIGRVDTTRRELSCSYTVGTITIDNEDCAITVIVSLNLHVCQFMVLRIHRAMALKSSTTPV